MMAVSNSSRPELQSAIGHQALIPKKIFWPYFQSCLEINSRWKETPFTRYPSMIIIVVIIIILLLLHNKKPEVSISPLTLGQ